MITIPTQARSHILCKRKTVHFENIDRYDETGKTNVGLIGILPRSCSSVKRGYPLERSSALLRQMITIVDDQLNIDTAPSWPPVSRPC